MSEHQEEKHNFLENTNRHSPSMESIMSGMGVPNDMEICIDDQDKWMQDTWVFSTRWCATLENGYTVWQDDGRPDIKEESAWVRLKNYCEHTGFGIKSLSVQFRHNKYVTVWEDKQAYYFGKMLRASFSSAKKQDDVLNVNYYLLGYVKDEKVYIDKLHVPSLTLEDSFVRNIEDCTDNIIRGAIKQ